MSLTIGALARKAGIGVQTVRFYEREGLIEEVPRAASGYRMYQDDAVTRLTFIRRAQELGFTLKEIRELIALQHDRTADCSEIRNAALAKLNDVEQRIVHLGRMRAALADLIQNCSGNGRVGDCVIIESLCGSAHDPAT